MKLPKNFDELPESDGTGLMKPPPGAYVCRVMRVQSTTSKGGRPMLVLDLDIAEGPFADWYAHDNDDRASKNLEMRWARLYQLTDGTSAPICKHMLKNFERSNPKYLIDDYTVGDEFDETSLKGKLIGVMLAGDEYAINGQVRMSLKPDRTLPISKVREGKAPEPRIRGADGKWRKASEPPPEPEPEPEEAGMELLDERDIPF